MGMKRSREEYAAKPSADNRQQIADSRSTSRPVLLLSAICPLLSAALSIIGSVQYRSPHSSPDERSSVRPCCVRSGLVSAAGDAIVAARHDRPRAAAALPHR